MSKAVHDMFFSIARSYDRANDALSFGVHRLWRRKSLKFAGIHDKHPANALDVCCGTGDFCKALQAQLHRESLIVGLDFVFPMLELASQKICYKPSDTGATTHAPRECRVELVHGDAQYLPFTDLTFDVCTIGFGIRNVDQPIVGLREMLRVLRSGGIAIILEFGTPSSPLIKPFYEWYSKHVMPRIGGFISGNKSAYEYLPETSAKFPCQDKFADLMKEAGFSKVTWRGFFGGIAYVYVGVK